MICTLTSLNRFALIAFAGLVLATNAWCKDIQLDIRPGEGVTQQKKISDYFAPLQGTNLDTVWQLLSAVDNTGNDPEFVALLAVLR